MELRKQNFVRKLQLFYPPLFKVWNRSLSLIDSKKFIKKFFLDLGTFLLRNGHIDFLRHKDAILTREVGRVHPKIVRYTPDNIIYMVRIFFIEFKMS